MSHDTHFLQRLSRVTQSQADRALALYRDPRLVRALLQDAKIPEGAERVAIALEAEDSPHVIVQRDGHFVTCLGAGMKTGEWPVLSRAKLDGALARVTRHRDAAAALEEMQKRNARSLTILYGRILRAGDRADREDAEALLALQPILGRWFLEHGIESYGEVMDHIRLQGVDPAPARERAEKLKMLWARVWSMSHDLVLGASEHIASEDPELARMAVRTASLAAGMGGSTVGTLLRFFWAAARLGRDSVDLLKELDRFVGHPFTSAPFRGALAAIGHSHARVRGEVVKYLSKPAPLGELFVGEVLAQGQALNHYIDQVLQRFLDDPRQLALDTAQSRDTLLPEDIRGKVDTLAWIGSNVEPAPIGAAYYWALGSLPEALEGTAAQFFLPRAINECYDPQEPATILAYLRSSSSAVQIDLTRIPKPMRREAKPGRNEPCPCGSGAKFKKCCEGKAAAGSS